MFERYTDRAGRAIDLAQQEAKVLHHSRIGTEHLLLGLIHEGEGVAAKALESLEITLDAARRQVKKINGQGQQASSGHIPFTPRAKKVLDLSRQESMQLGHNYIGTEHLLLGLIRENSSTAAQVLMKLGAEPNRIRQQVIQLLAGYQGNEDTPANAHAEGGIPPASVILDQFGRNLTYEASEGKLDPVIGREKEIVRVTQLLSADSKNNPVLVSVTTVGPMAVVEGLAQKIAEGDIPEPLKGKQIYTLHLASPAGDSRPESLHDTAQESSIFHPTAVLAMREHEEKIARVRHEKRTAVEAQDFDKTAELKDKENKLLANKTILESCCNLSDLDVMATIIEEIRARDEIILFIDDLCTMVSERTSGSSIGHSSIFKSALTSGELRIIGATTPEEYRRQLEIDEALQEWLQPIPVAEPTTLYSSEMLRIALRAATRARIPDDH